MGRMKEIYMEIQEQFDGNIPADFDFDAYIEDIKHYLGDFRIFPNIGIIENAVKDFISAPAGYSIDFGITDKGETILVECNDGWSLGNYGLDSADYTKLLSKRWLEILKFNS